MHYHYIQSLEDLKKYIEKKYKEYGDELDVIVKSSNEMPQIHSIEKIIQPRKETIVLNQDLTSQLNLSTSKTFSIGQLREKIAS